jgi:3-methyladenine DNA glycosylase AlkD
MNTILSTLRQELQSNSDAQTRESGERFFKEEVHLYGVKTAIVGKLAKKYFNQIKNELSKEQIFALCDQLWQSGYLEESFVACDWAYSLHKQFTSADFQIFGKWVEQYVHNWASCDTLCNHTIGTLIEMYPEHLADLKKWTQSKNRWVRRASAVTLIIPARHGQFLPDILGIADLLLVDTDDLVQKGYGWMLKAASQAHQSEVFEYILKNKQTMPRTALRYAIEKMPPEMRKQAMVK